MLAHALPPPPCGGACCAWEVFQTRPAENTGSPARGIADFVHLPSEQNRQALRELVDLVRPQSPPHFLGHAAILSCGSMTEPPLLPVAPKPFLTGRLVGVSIYLASVAREPLKYHARMNAYLDLGLDVARGTNLWATPAEVCTPTEMYDFAGSLSIAPNLENSAVLLGQ